MQTVLEFIHWVDAQPGELIPNFGATSKYYEDDKEKVGQEAIDQVGYVYGCFAEALMMWARKQEPNNLRQFAFYERQRLVLEK